MASSSPAATAGGVSPLDSLFLSRIEHIISKEQWLTKDPTSDLRQASRARYRPKLCATRVSEASAPALDASTSMPLETPRCSRNKPLLLALVLLLLLICVVLVGSAQQQPAPRED